MSGRNRLAGEAACWRTAEDDRRQVEESAEVAAEKAARIGVYAQRAAHGLPLFARNPPRPPSREEIEESTYVPPACGVAVLYCSVCGVERKLVRGEGRERTFYDAHPDAWLIRKALKLCPRCRGAAGAA